MPVVDKIQKLTSAPEINIVCSVVPLPHRLLSKPNSVQESLLLCESSSQREMMRRQEKNGSKRKRRGVKTGKNGPALPCSLVWSSVWVFALQFPAHSDCCDHPLLWS